MRHTHITETRRRVQREYITEEPDGKEAEKGNNMHHTNREGEQTRGIHHTNKAESRERTQSRRIGMGEMRKEHVRRERGA